MSWRTFNHISKWGKYHKRRQGEDIWDTQEKLWRVRRKRQHWSANVALKWWSQWIFLIFLILFNINYLGWPIVRTVPTTYSVPNLGISPLLKGQMTMNPLLETNQRPLHREWGYLANWAMGALKTMDTNDYQLKPHNQKGDRSSIFHVKSWQMIKNETWFRNETLQVLTPFQVLSLLNLCKHNSVGHAQVDRLYKHPQVLW